MLSTSVDSGIFMWMGLIPRHVGGGLAGSLRRQVMLKEKCAQRKESR